MTTRPSFVEIVTIRLEFRIAFHSDLPLPKSERPPFDIDGWTIAECSWLICFAITTSRQIESDWRLPILRRNWLPKTLFDCAQPLRKRSLYMWLLCSRIPMNPKVYSFLISLIGCDWIVNGLDNIPISNNTAGESEPKWWNSCHAHNIMVGRCFTSVFFSQVSRKRWKQKFFWEKSMASISHESDLTHTPKINPTRVHST